MFEEVVENFGKSEGDIIEEKMLGSRGLNLLFPLDTYVVSCPTLSKNLERTLLLALMHCVQLRQILFQKTRIK